MDGPLHPGMAVAIWPDPDAHALVKRIRRHEGCVDFHRRMHRRQGFAQRHRGAGGAFMRDHRVAGVGQVIDQHLPVAFVHVAQHAAGDFQFADRGAVHHVVEAGEGGAEIIVEADAVRAEPGEDEIPIHMHRADRGHALGGFGLLKSGIVITLRQRDGGDAAIGAEAPGMIRAAEEFAGVAARVVGDAGAFVRAAIMQHADGLVGVADHDHRGGADGGGDEVANGRNLAGVADINPGIGEEMRHFMREHLGRGVGIAVHFIVPYQGFNGGVGQHVTAS